MELLIFLSIVIGKNEYLSTTKASRNLTHGSTTTDYPVFALHKKVRSTSAEYNRKIPDGFIHFWVHAMRFSQFDGVSADDTLYCGYVLYSKRRMCDN